VRVRSGTFFACALLYAVANAQTQADLNDDACGAYREADKKLDAIYQQLLEQHKDDADFTTRLRKAQRAWLAFRDAELEAIYPADNKREEYGSIYPMCSCLEQAALVNHHIEQLSGWLTAEGENAYRTSGSQALGWPIRLHFTTKLSSNIKRTTNNR